MKELKLKIAINKPVAAAFEFATNPANTPKWLDSVTIEETSEWPPKIGTTYRNRGDGDWDEYEVTELVANKTFTLSRKGDTYHVRYSFKTLGDSSTEMEYHEWMDEGALDNPFTLEILEKLKRIIEQERNPIVNEEDEVIAYKDRNNIKPTDIYRVSGLWVKNSAGDVLLAQRKKTKSHHGGKWSSAVAGTVEEGETYYSNIVKEAEEEIGLKNIKPKTGPKIRVRGEYNHFSQTYILVIDKPAEDFKIQENEVERVKWFKHNELETELREHPNDYADPDILKWALEEL